MMTDQIQYTQEPQPIFDPQQLAYLQQQLAYQQQSYQYPPQFFAGAAPFPYGFAPQFPSTFPYQHVPQRSPSLGNRVLWIGNLHQDTDEKELNEVFSRFGNIEGIKLVRTKACGFVTFVDPGNAQEAHDKMNRFSLHNQEIKVGWGKAEQSNYSQIRGTPYDGSLQPNLPDINRELPVQPAARTLWVGNVTPMVTENVIRDYFTPFGNIEMVRMWVSRHCAFVTYSNVEEATKAKVQLDRQRILDTIIRVNYGKA